MGQKRSWDVMWVEEEVVMELEVKVRVRVRVRKEVRVDMGVVCRPPGREGKCELTSSSPLTSILSMRKLRLPRSPPPPNTPAPPGVLGF